MKNGFVFLTIFVSIILAGTVVFAYEAFPEEPYIFTGKVSDSKGNIVKDNLEIYLKINGFVSVQDEINDNGMYSLSAPSQYSYNFGEVVFLIDEIDFESEPIPFNFNGGKILEIDIEIPFISQIPEEGEEEQESGNETETDQDSSNDSDSGSSVGGGGGGGGGSAGGTSEELTETSTEYVRDECEESWSDCIDGERSKVCFDKEGNEYLRIESCESEYSSNQNNPKSVYSGSTTSETEFHGEAKSDEGDTLSRETGFALGNFGTEESLALGVFILLILVLALVIIISTRR